MDDGTFRVDVGSVIRIRVQGQPERRYLVTDRRPGGPLGWELTVLCDPEDDDGHPMKYRSFH